MDWTKARVLELIQNYESEPVLWDPQEPNYKKTRFHYEAWMRIKSNTSWEVTIEELKTKMKSLMAYYRAHINKYKTSLKSGASTDEVYQTTWFAFSAMNNFLAPVYIRSTMSTSQFQEENETRERIDTEDSSVEEMPKSRFGKKRRRDLPSEIIEAKQEMKKAFQNIKSTLDDEYEIFGKLIASKIRKLKNHNTREIIMNDIYKLIFRHSCARI